MVEKLFLDPSLKSQNWVYFWINSLKFYTVCFYCMPNWGLSKYIETKLRVICFYLDKAFLETKRGLELVSLLHFLHDFWRKIYLLLNCINWANIIVWLLLLRGILTNMCIVIVWSPGCNVINLEINLTFLIKLWERKELLRRNKQQFKKGFFKKRL